MKFGIVRKPFNLKYQYASASDGRSSGTMQDVWLRGQLDAGIGASGDQEEMLSIRKPYRAAGTALNAASAKKSTNRCDAD
jgi:hypothetical protein